MFHWFRDHLDPSKIIDGVSLGFGVLVAYLASVIILSVTRALSGSGSSGIVLMGRFLQGWWSYARGENRNVINITLNTIHEGRLKFDTIIADRRLWEVWSNIYIVQYVKRAAKYTTVEDPVVKIRRDMLPIWLRHFVEKAVGTRQIVSNGKKERVAVVREDDFASVYHPLISLASEHMTNSGSIEMALGYPVREYRFIMALTFEQLSNRRSRHFRVMMMWEELLLNLPTACPLVDREEHQSRYHTLQIIAEQYKKNPEHFGVIRVWRRIENDTGQESGLHRGEAFGQSGGPASFGGHDGQPTQHDDRRYQERHDVIPTFLLPEGMLPTS